MGSPWIMWQGIHCPSLPSGQVWLLILKIFRLIWSFLVLYCDDKVPSRHISNLWQLVSIINRNINHKKAPINLQPSINHLGKTIINLPTPHSSHSWKPEIPWKHPSTTTFLGHRLGCRTLPFPDRTRDLANILRWRKSWGSCFLVQTSPSWNQIWGKIHCCIYDIDYDGYIYIEGCFQHGRGPQTIKNDPFLGTQKTMSCLQPPEVEWIICYLLLTSRWMSSATRGAVDQKQESILPQWYCWWKKSCTVDR